MQKRKIFPTITTVNGNHLKKLREINELKLEEICVFPNCLELPGRKKLYLLLEKSCVKRVLLVHLRNDMELWELEYFIKKFQTRMFNIHSPSRATEKYPVLNYWSKYKKQINIENGVLYSFNEKEIRQFAGICLDLSHLEDSRLLLPKTYKKDVKIIDKYLCNCAHISAVGKSPIYDKKLNHDFYNNHFFNALSEFDYLKNYPKKYFPKIIALELENSIKEQLKAKKYIEKLLTE